jgi:hypothetical protein
MTRLLKIAYVVILLSKVLVAQGELVVCDSTVQFVDRNMVDYTLKVRSMRGKVVDANGAGVPGACIALFNSDHSKLVQTFRATDDGDFTANEVKSGDYWLVVKDLQNAFCPASARIKLRRASGKSNLIVDMRARGVDVCSFCEAK